MANNASVFKTQVDTLTTLQSAGVIDNSEAREFIRTSEIGGLDYLSEDAPQQPNPEDMAVMNGQQPKEQNTESLKGFEEWQKNMLG